MESVADSLGFDILVGGLFIDVLLINFSLLQGPWQNHGVPFYRPWQAILAGKADCNGLWETVAVCGKHRRGCNGLWETVAVCGKL